jgi:hypothetical protein
LSVEIACATAAIAELAKVLLYLNLPDAEKLRVTERSDLETRLRGLGPKKAAKLGRKLATAYDRILIGPSADPEAAGSGDHGGLARGDDGMSGRTGAAGTSGGFAMARGWPRAGWGGFCRCW